MAAGYGDYGSNYGTYPRGGDYGHQVHVKPRSASYSAQRRSRLQGYVDDYPEYGVARPHWRSSSAPRTGYPEYGSSSHYRSSSQPRSSSHHDYYPSPRRRTRFREPPLGPEPGGYREPPPVLDPSGYPPREYWTSQYERALKEHYAPRQHPASTYLPPQYNHDYPPRPSRTSLPYYGSAADYSELPVPYISPMGYRTVSDRRKHQIPYSCWDSHKYEGMRPPTQTRPTDYSYRPRRAPSRYTIPTTSEYYNPGYSRPPPRRRVAWEDLSTSALNYRDSSRSRSLPHFSSPTRYTDTYRQRPHSSNGDFRVALVDPYRRSHSSAAEYREPSRDRYDYDDEYGDNYHDGGPESYGGGGHSYSGGGHSRSNPDIAQKGFYEDDYERYWDGRY